MKITNHFKALVASIAGVGFAVAATATVFAITPGSIQYKGTDTVGPNFAAFNVYYDVPSVGSEADFIRVKRDGEPNSALKTTYDTTCKTGDRFDVWFYVHNGANPSANENGNGPGVARNTVAKLALPQGEQTSITLTGNLTSSNTEAASDTATINCGGKKFKVAYVTGSGNAFLDLPNKNVALPDAIAATGTQIGTNALDGNLWGCWEQRVWMNMKIVVTEVTEPPKPEPQPQALSCKMLVDRKSLALGVTLQPYATNVTVNSYKIDFGDGTVVNTQQATHTYTTYGDHKVVGTVTGTGTQDNKTVTATCEYAFNEKEPTTPPVTPPTPPTPPTPTPVTPTTPPVMPSTGAGSMVGLISGVSIVGAIGHRFWMIRRMQ